MPRSPLPLRHGLNSAWLRTPDTGVGSWATLAEHLAERLPLTPERIHDMLADGRFVDERGNPFAPDSGYRPNTMVFFHRDLPDETPPPGELTVLYRDDRIVVLDKPHFTSTIPRGRHILYSATVLARRELDLPELSPAHRLDRLTAGVLLCTTRREFRAAYQCLFENHVVTKEYLAVGRVNPAMTFPVEVRSHIRKDKGELRVTERTDIAPNAHTLVEALDIRPDKGLYRCLPTTGRTHQLRVHLNGLGLSILNDPFYPDMIDQDLADFSRPLQLLAHRLSFVDPITGEQREFTSERQLQEWGPGFPEPHPDVSLT